MLSLLEVARAEEARQARGLATVSSVSEAVAGGVMARDVPGAWNNRATGLGMSGPVSGEEIDRLTAFYTEGGIEPRIEICPYADESLLRRVKEAGFVPCSFNTLLFRPLTSEDSDGGLGEAAPQGVTVSIVSADDARAVDEYITAVGRGFSPTGEEPDAWQRGISARVLADSRVCAFAARVDGQVVGGGAVDLSLPVAALFGLSVVEAYRKRGIQRALMAARLALGAARGARFATIGASPGETTERNARRLGFEVAYTRLVVVRPGAGLVAVGGRAADGA